MYFSPEAIVECGVWWDIVVLWWEKVGKYFHLSLFVFGA